MTKEDYDRNVERLLLKKINAEQEIERLKEDNKVLKMIADNRNIIADGIGVNYFREKQENEQLHSIIKEVRELIKKEQQHYQRRDVYINANDFLEILDKVEENK